MSIIKCGFAAAISLAGIIICSIPVFAVPVSMSNGIIFDADYYAAAYPDVAAVCGTDFNSLFSHYMQYGIHEGRLAYAGDIGQQSLPLPQAAAVASSESETVPCQSGSTRATSVSGNLVTSFDICLYPSKSSNSNARLACDILDGTVIPPGSEFSYNTAIGRRTADKGFVKAAVIINKKSAVGYGGGICKISTGIYNLCLNASLPVTERHGHSHSIGYVPAGRDATVSYGTKDFKFVNPYTYPLYIGTAYDSDGYHFYLFS